MRSRAADAAARRLRPIFAAAALLLVLLLAVFAYALAHAQSQQRDDVAKRFIDRARVAATVNESLFALATNSARTTDAQRFGGKTVDQTKLAQRTALQQQRFAAIYDSNGNVIAKAGAAPAGVPALVRQAMQSKQVVYSSLMRGPHGTITIQSAVAYPTKYGTRVDFSEGNAQALAQFLNSFLTKLPTVAHARSYVIDQADKVIATPGERSQPGAPLPDSKLARAAAKSDSGSYDGNRYFAAAAIAGTPWRIVLAASQDALYSSVKTTASWIIFGAFVLVSALGLFLLWRVLISGAELERADLSRRHALEINDNVVQRLVVAKYALDRGATESSKEKLAETLRETQQLVTSLLEEREIEPGSLRREAPAETEGRPDPAARSLENQA